MVDLVISEARRLIGEQNINWLQHPSMIGEDFAYFMQLVPSCMFYLGCGFKDKKNYPLHNTRFEPDESCITTGVELIAASAMRYLNG